MPWVPAGYEPPTAVVLDGPQPGLHLRVLAPADTEADYEAVMGARERLLAVFGPASTWPAEDLTLEGNTADLARHEAEFHAREAFAYSIWSAAGAYLGCVYIDPIRSRQEHDRRRDRFDARIFFWTSNEGRPHDAAMEARLKRWLADAWPFARVAWPGRDIGWEDWQAMA